MNYVALGIDKKLVSLNKGTELKKMIVNVNFAKKVEDDVFVPFSASLLLIFFSINKFVYIILFM